MNELYICVQELKNSGQHAMEEHEINHWLARFDQLMIYGLQQHPPPVKTTVKQGVVKKSKTQNLLQRFTDFRDNILHFARDFNVPFSNNLAEQAVRMMKVKQKISGCFRSEKGAKDFSATRSYIATMKKQKQNVMKAIVAAVNGNPLPTQV